MQVVSRQSRGTMRPYAIALSMLIPTNEEVIQS